VYRNLLRCRGCQFAKLASVQEQTSADFRISFWYIFLPFIMLYRLKWNERILTKILLSLANVDSRYLVTEKARLGNLVSNSKRQISRLLQGVLRHSGLLCNRSTFHRIPRFSSWFHWDRCIFSFSGQPRGDRAGNCVLTGRGRKRGPSLPVIIFNLQRVYPRTRRCDREIHRRGSSAFVRPR